MPTACATLQWDEPPLCCQTTAQVFITPHLKSPVIGPLWGRGRGSGRLCSCWGKRVVKITPHHTSLLGRGCYIAAFPPATTTTTKPRSLRATGLVGFGLLLIFPCLHAPTYLPILGTKNMAKRLPRPSISFQEGGHGDSKL